ncbi:uncharacterized protein LOC129959308 [Argiope bruennichi]|uniref:uncharacterized protein LOC129959308 n=1 Tax=Argiope bruennichi TaxID=94029 RepID=UPI002494F05C|nr:uncharacterized protein LOC129959308 [Argiope bruennichi]
MGLMKIAASLHSNSVRNVEQHKKHLTEVFNRIQQYGLRISLWKSVMGVNVLEFLGYFITPNDSKPIPEKVQAIMDDKLNENLHKLQINLRPRSATTVPDFSTQLETVMRSPDASSVKEATRQENAPSKRKSTTLPVLTATLLDT